MSSLATKIVGLAIALFVMASLAPVAITNIFNTTTTGWDTATVTVWRLLPLMGVIAIMLGIIAYAGLRITAR